MLNHDEYPKIKRILRGIGPKISTPEIKVTVYLDTKKARYDAEAGSTRNQLIVKINHPDNFSRDEIESRVDELIINDRIFNSIKEEYPDSRVYEYQGEPAIYIPSFRGSLVLGSLVL